MCTDVSKAGPTSGCSDNPAHPSSAKLAVRCSDAYEYTAIRSRRGAAPAQISDYCLADILWKRQRFNSIALPTNKDRASTPIDIIQPKPSEFARTEPEANEHRQNGKIPTSHSRAPVTRCQQCLNLTRL